MYSCGSASRHGRWIVAPTERNLHSMQMGSDWVATIGWLAEIDTESLATIQRVPTGYWLRSKAGTRNGAFAIKRVSAQELEIRTTRAGAIISRRCRVPCVMTSEQVLALE